MSLALPWLLLLLLLVPSLVLVRYAGKRRPSLRFSDGDTLSRIRPSLSARLWVVLPVLYGLGLTLLVVALAHPRKGLEESVVRTEAVDIILLVDVSSSMRALDLSGPTGNGCSASAKFKAPQSSRSPSGCSRSSMSTRAWP